jgi:hypothetical protein
MIQIPCLNEEDQLPLALAELPRAVPGCDVVEWLVIDDGSTDRTVEVAREHGVDHIVSFPANRGLAAAFQAGLDACLKLGADVIVNTDADNQYDASAIPDLVAPIVDNRADVVIGDRDVRSVDDFSFVKRRLQVLGSWVVQKASRTDVPDTTSGFRAYSREAALGLTVVSPYTYTIESIIQAGRSGSAIAHIPVGTNPKVRESRLFGSTWGYIRRNAGTIRVVHGDRSGHLQSIVVASVLFVGALQVAALAILADMMRNQRVVTQRALERIRRLEVESGVAPAHYLGSEKGGGAMGPRTLDEAMSGLEGLETTVDRASGVTSRSP